MHGLSLGSSSSPLGLNSLGRGRGQRRRNRCEKKLKKQGNQTADSSNEEGEGKKGKKGKGGKSKGGDKGDAAKAEGGKTLSTKDLSLMVRHMNKLVLAHDDSILNLERIALVTIFFPEESPSMAAGRSEGQK